MIPNTWFNSIGNEHPFSEIAWYLFDQKDKMPEDVFDDILRLLKDLERNEFIELNESTEKDLELIDQANKNVYEKLLKKHNKNKKKSGDMDLPILQQEKGEAKKAPSIFDLGVDAHKLTQMVELEYNRLALKKEKRTASKAVNQNKKLKTAEKKSAKKKQTK